MGSPNYNEASELKPFDSNRAYEARSANSAYFIDKHGISLARASLTYVPVEIQPQPQDARDIRAGLLRLIQGGKSTSVVSDKVLDTYNSFLGEDSGLFLSVPNADLPASKLGVVKVTELRPSAQPDQGPVIIVEGAEGATGTLEPGTQIFFGGKYS